MARHVIASLILVLLAAVPASTAIFTVTKLTDTNDGACDGDCSLREAVIAANSLGGADEILLPPGVVVLTIAGTGEDAAATGDLDILDSVDIIGDPTLGTSIDAKKLDTVFEVSGASTVVTFENLTVRNGLTDRIGAGILVRRAAVTLRRAFVTSNTGSTGLGGAGIYANLFASVVLEESTVAGNSPGEVKTSQADLVATNSTIGQRSGSAEGVAVSVSAAIVSLANVTVYRDPVSALSLVAVNVSTVTIRDSILRGACNILVNSDVVSEGGNIESPGMAGASTCGLVHATDQVVEDAGFYPLGFYGGLTPTHGLASDSPAVGGAVHCPPPDTDQRGEPRTDGDCDSGALEVQPLDNFLPIFTDGFESGDTSAWSGSVP